MTQICQNSQVLDADALNELKLKITKDYESFLKQLYKGHRNDYTHILNAISFIDTAAALDNQKLLYQYFINNGV